MPETTDLPDLDLPDIEETRRLLGDYVITTPSVAWRPDPSLQLDGFELFLKLEFLQVTGSFKPRGAMSVLLGAAPETTRAGVTAVSAGNHAISVAYSAKQLGLSAKVVLPKFASPFRIAKCQALGAEVVLADTITEAFELVEQIAEQEKRLFVHPFEGIATIRGTATVGLEFLRQVDGPLDAVIVPVGGGGLCAGIACAAAKLQPSCAVYGVEPVGSCALWQSLRKGEPIRLDRVDTIADSLATPLATPVTFGLLQKYTRSIALVEEDAIRQAMRDLAVGLRIIPEPAMAVSLAALRGELAEELAGKRVGIVLCGNNLSIEEFVRLTS